jgi:transcriptional regulator with XRE-family HTH domain
VAAERIQRSGGARREWGNIHSDMMRASMDVPATLRGARHRAGLSQAELARRAGTSQATISAYESARKAPSVATLDRLLAVMGSRLAVEPRRPAVEPSASELSRRGRTLVAVLELAEALPTRHDPALRFPRLR